MGDKPSVIHLNNHLYSIVIDINPHFCICFVRPENKRHLVTSAGILSKTQLCGWVIVINPYYTNTFKQFVVHDNTIQDDDYYNVYDHGCVG